MLIVTSPTDGSAVNWSSVYISGMVGGAVDLQFNNESVAFDVGEFNQLVALTSSRTPAGEPNVIVVRAGDEVGNVATVVLKIMCDRMGPGLTLEPVPEITEEELVFINGSVGDVDDVAAIHLGGSVIECDADGTFSVLWRLSGPITELRVRAVDHVGNEDVQNITIVLDRQTDGPDGGGEEGISTPLILGLIAILFVLGVLVTLFALRHIDRGRTDT